MNEGCEIESSVTMDGVREYAECGPVKLSSMRDGRLVVNAVNQGGFDGTLVDLVDILSWIKRYRPELLTGLGNEQAV